MLRNKNFNNMCCIGKDVFVFIMLLIFCSLTGNVDSIDEGLLRSILVKHGIEKEKIEIVLNSVCIESAETINGSTADIKPILSGK